MKYCLVAIRKLTNFVQLRPLPNRTAPVVAEAIASIFNTLGPPEILVTDKGSKFCNDNLGPLLKTLRTSRILALPAVKTTTGQVERPNQNVAAFFTQDS